MLRAHFKIILFVLISCFCTYAQSWQLIWSDEFDGNSLDLNNWTRETGGGGWGNNELQYYTDREINSFIQNGNLIIKAFQENYGGNAYTSARLKTQNKQFFKYGKIEARMKLPFGQGIWPAFWMLGQNISTVGWPACGEIDIMEMIGGQNRENTVYGTAHWDNNGQHAQYGGQYTLSSGSFSDDFHIFSIEWNQNSIKWFVDNIQYHIMDITPVGVSEFHQDFFIILNLAIGGNWPGYPDPTTTFPQQVEVDYVRVYKDVNNFPSVSITSPVNNAQFNPGANIPITAEASDANGSIQYVEFYQGSARIGADYTFPYSFSWNNIYEGCYQLSARAKDNSGLISNSEIVNITVGSGCTHSPYLGSPVLIPGSLECENYNLGGNNVAYNDVDPNTNQGGMYRSNEGVDIENCMDTGGGYNVGWLSGGEWLNYFVEITQAGTYDIIFRVASTVSTGIIKLEVDGADKTGNVNIPNTGGWQNWTDVIKNNVFLEGGIHVLSLRIISGNFNINRIIFPINTTGINHDEQKPVHFNLNQNYPNPFNPTTTIDLTVPVESNVSIKVYDSLGSELSTLLNERLQIGEYSIEFNASNLTSQILYYRIIATTEKSNHVYTDTKKMILLK